MLIPIRIKPGHQIDGEGEGLGIDSTGQTYTFWRFQGHMEVPIDLALKLEKERPQRFEMIDQKLLDDLLEIVALRAEEEDIIQDVITLKKLKDMTKDDINDWAAKREYDVNTRDTKLAMMNKLIIQIEKRTGKKVEW